MTGALLGWKSSLKNATAQGHEGTQFPGQGLKMLCSLKLGSNWIPRKALEEIFPRSYLPGGLQNVKKKKKVGIKISNQLLFYLLES